MGTSLRLHVEIRMARYTMRLCTLFVLFACALSDDFSNIERVRCYSNGLWFNTPKPASGAEWFVAECPVDFFCHTVQYCGPPLSHPTCGTIIAGCHHVNDPQLTGHGSGCSGLKAMLSQQQFDGTTVIKCCDSDLCNSW